MQDKREIVVDLDTKMRIAGLVICCSISLLTLQLIVSRLVSPEGLCKHFFGHLAFYIQTLDIMQ